MTSKKSSGTQFSSFPYKVDYNDHFETPLRAYKDILPLLDLVSPANTSSDVSAKLTKESKVQNKRKRSLPDRDVRSDHTLYDPYYCSGRTRTLLSSLGFANVIHRKRDFYADVARGVVPEHDALITNPPYSSDHKERCVEFAVRGLREGGRKFFLLMPNYVAQKEYYRKLVGRGGGKEADDIVYVVPPSPYEYDHPEGTGHEVPPFASLWFCGIGKDWVEKARGLYNKAGGPRIACSLRELQQLGAVRSGNRKNPKQRRKIRQLLAAAAGKADVGTKLADNAAAQSMERNGGADRKRKHGIGAQAAKYLRSATQSPKQGKSKKKSKFRDANGVRKKRRF